MTGTGSEVPLRPLAITMGDPAGIGGEITLKAWRELRRDITTGSLPPLVLYADPGWVEDHAGPMQLNGRVCPISAPEDAGSVAASGDLPVIPVPLCEPVVPGRASAANGPAVIRSIDLAVEAALAGTVSGLVTNPIHKKSLYDCGFTCPGHTEYLAELAARAEPEKPAPWPVMMLASDELSPALRVIPVTIHIPLASVPKTLTVDAIMRCGEIVANALKQNFGIPAPRLAVTGLNPHAGEEGAMGQEDITLVAPAIELLRQKGINVSGPLPADTLFHSRAREGYDAALCMYHDQALIPIKTLAFDQGVNVTLGLPFIRTSPDHGTAFNIAGQGVAKPDSLLAAIRMAAKTGRNLAGYSLQ